MLETIAVYIVHVDAVDIKCVRKADYFHYSGPAA